MARSAQSTMQVCLIGGRYDGAVMRPPKVSFGYVGGGEGRLRWFSTPGKGRELYRHSGSLQMGDGLTTIRYAFAEYTHVRCPGCGSFRLRVPECPLCGERSPL